MKTYDVKNSYSPQATRVNCGREELANSVQINWSWHTLILYSQSLHIFAVVIFFKKLPKKLHFREFEET
jgi:hypothetical protein